MRTEDTAHHGERAEAHEDEGGYDGHQTTFLPVDSYHSTQSPSVVSSYR
jgi:hypothetical protein